MPIHTLMALWGGADKAQADTSWGGILNVSQADASLGGNMRGRATRNRAGLRESFGLPRHMLGVA